MSTTTTETTCPTWCTSERCLGDHSATAGEWPTMTVRPLPLDRDTQLCILPAWVEMDGLAPEVVVFLDVPRGLEFYLSPARAREMAAHLVTVADALDGRGEMVPAGDEIMGVVSEIREECRQIAARLEGATLHG